MNVLVIESGSLDVPEEDSVSVPGLYNPPPHLYHAIESIPQAALESKAFPAVAGRVVGGGSVINGMSWSRSSKGEYDTWQNLSTTNLSYEVLLPYFQKSENFSIPDPSFAKEANISYVAEDHGFDGPIHVSFSSFYYNASGLPPNIINSTVH